MENEGLIGYYNEVYRCSGREGLSVKGKNGKDFIVWTAGLALLGISVTLSVYGGKINARHAPGKSMNARDEAGGLTVAGKEADESIGVKYGLEALANVFEISDNPVYSAQKAGKVSEGREEESALRLSGIRDIYLAKGQECDFLEGVFAESGKGGKDAKPAGKVAVDANLVSEITENNVNNIADNAVKIANSTGALLPSTGGIGTTIFTVGGCAIMIIAAGLYFATRRKSAK